MTEPTVKGANAKTEEQPEQAKSDTQKLGNAGSTTTETTIKAEFASSSGKVASVADSASSLDTSEDMDPTSNSKTISTKMGVVLKATAEDPPNVQVKGEGGIKAASVKGPLQGGKKRRRSRKGHSGINSSRCEGNLPS